jgi:hypothetical protein
MTNATAAEARKTSKVKQPASFWLPRMFDGCTLGTWVWQLARCRFRLSGRNYFFFVFTIFMHSAHSVLGLMQKLVYSGRISRTVLRQPPIFIIGHWRTGTTLLHEMLILDPRHSFPNSCQCFLPTHFLLSEKIMTNYLPFLLPKKRPMDNMSAGWQRPQEDEFGMCMLGQPSPYWTIAYPRTGLAYPEYMSLDKVPPKAVARWKDTFLHFLKSITYRDGRRLVLKSPPHTCRIKVLKEMFPEAVFIHIVRNPYVVYPSTVNLWKTLYTHQGNQTPTFKGLEEYVFETFTNLYDRLEKTRDLLDDSHFCEIRYEDLVDDPIGQMRSLYEQLNLGDFEELLPRLEKYLSGVANYETNRYELSAEEREVVKRRWGHIIEKYGYSDEQCPS